MRTSWSWRGGVIDLVCSTEEPNMKGLLGTSAPLPVEPLDNMESELEGAASADEGPKLNVGFSVDVTGGVAGVALKVKGDFAGAGISEGSLLVGCPNVKLPEVPVLNTGFGASTVAVTLVEVAAG